MRIVVKTDLEGAEQLAKQGHIVSEETMRLTHALQDRLAAYDLAQAAAKRMSLRDALEGAMTELASDLPRAQMVHHLRTRIGTAMALLDFTDLSQPAGEA